MSNFALANQRRAPLFERQALFASCESLTSLHSKMLFGCLVVLLFVQTYYLSLTTKLQANEPRQRKKL